MRIYNDSYRLFASLTFIGIAIGLGLGVLIYIIIGERDWHIHVQTGSLIDDAPAIRANFQQMEARRKGYVVEDIVRKDIGSRIFNRGSTASAMLHSHDGEISAIEKEMPLLAIVIIVDDELDLPHRELWELDSSVSLSLLPYLPEVASLARSARAHGHELLLQLPILGDQESVNAPNMLHSGLSHGELVRRLSWHLHRFNEYVGVNSPAYFASSRATHGNGESNIALLSAIMPQIASGGLLFVDGATEENSLAGALAQAHSIETGDNLLVFDRINTAGAIASNLDSATEAARQWGGVIVFGHGRADTIRSLQAWLDRGKPQDVRLAPVSAVIDKLRQNRMAIADN